MKQILSLFIFLLMLASCKKDETRSVYTMPAFAPAFTSSISSIVLDSTKRNDKAVSFKWGTVSFGIRAAVTYSLEFDTSSIFTKPAAQVMNTDTLRDYTVEELNSVALQAGVEAEKATNLYVRVKAEVRQNGTSSDASRIPPMYSATVTIRTTAYPPPVARLWVLGDYNNWKENNGTARSIADVKGNGAYEGYIYFPSTSGFSFKILTALDWDQPLYGYQSATKMTLGNGTLGNLYTSGEGYYFIKANTTSLEWSATRTTWSVVGDAVTTWDTDTQMTYDIASGTWIIPSVAIKNTGSFKFRANNAWPINYGPTNGKLVLEGGNITVSQAGNYKVVLDLSDAANYKYTLTKL